MNTRITRLHWFLVVWMGIVPAAAFAAQPAGPTTRRTDQGALNVRSLEDFLNTIPPAAQTELVEGFVKKGLIPVVPHVWSYVHDPGLIEESIDLVTEPFAADQIDALSRLTKQAGWKRDTRVFGILYRYNVDGADGSLIDLLNKGDRVAAEILAAGQKNPSLRRSILQVFRKHPDDRLLADAVVGWGDEGQGSLRDAMNAAPDEALYYAFLLSTVKDSAGHDLLVKAYRENEISDAMWLATAGLARLEPENSRPIDFAVRVATDDSQKVAYVRDQAIQALGRIGTVRARDALRQIVTDFLKCDPARTVPTVYSDRRYRAVCALLDLIRLKDDTAKTLGPSLLKKLVAEKYFPGLQLELGDALVGLGRGDVVKSVGEIMGHHWVDAIGSINSLRPLPEPLMPRLSRFAEMENDPEVRIPVNFLPQPMVAATQPG